MQSLNVGFQDAAMQHVVFCQMSVQGRNCTDWRTIQRNSEVSRIIITKTEHLLMDVMLTDFCLSAVQLNKWPLKADYPPHISPVKTFISKSGSCSPSWSTFSQMGLFGYGGLWRQHDPPLSTPV